MNTAGSVVGSLLAAFALVPLLGLKGTLLLLAVVQVALGWAFIAHTDIPARRRIPWLAGSGAALLAGVVGAFAMLEGPNPFDHRARWATRGTTPVVEAHRDGVCASSTVVSYPGWGKALRIDGFEAAASHREAAYMPLMTPIPMLLHPGPRRLLVICFGTGGTAGAGLLHPGATLDVVDINRDVVELASHFAEWNHDVALDPRARVVVDDGRNFLLTTRERYDVITSEPMPPRFAGVVNLYSREYYQLARERLRPGGLVVQWLPMHLVSRDEAMAILRTVREVFPETTLWLHAYTGIIVARRDAPLEVDLARVARAFEPGALRDDLVRLGVRGPLEFALLCALSPAKVHEATARALAITDDRPSLEFHRPGPLFVPYQGDFTLEQARAMELIHRLRLGDDTPLANATAAQAARIGAARRRESHAALGDLYVWWGHADSAIAEFEAAARATLDGRTRAGLLLDASRAATLAGRAADARRLADESLAILPDDPDSVALRKALAPSPPR